MATKGYLDGILLVVLTKPCIFTHELSVYKPLRVMCDIFPEFYIDSDVRDRHFELSVWAISPGSIFL